VIEDAEFAKDAAVEELQVKDERLVYRLRKQMHVA